MAVFPENVYEKFTSAQAFFDRFYATAAARVDEKVSKHILYSLQTHKSGRKSCCCVEQESFFNVDEKRGDVVRERERISTWKSGRAAAEV